LKSLPHVTEILRPYMNLDWVKQEHLERGQARHAAYAAHLLSTWAPPLPPEDQGSLDSFRRWADKNVLETWFVEKSFTDLDLGYTSTIDWGGELTICPGAIGDWKPPSGKGPVTRAQVASYLHNAQKNKVPAEKGFILRMDPKGGIAKLEWLEIGSVDFAGFLSALNAWRYFNQ
jgi:hypothetical protein